VNLEVGKPDWLGRELDGSLAAELEAEPHVDCCGEHGEYHSFAWDGPLFGEPVPFRRGEELEIEGHRLLDLLPAAGGDVPESETATSSDEGTP
jgi:diphthamide synthase (EF-2-diphthine--ammonia ligase)